MKKRHFKNEVYENLSRIGKALSCAPRIEILDLLCQGPRTVEALSKQIGQPIGNTSQHLQVLKRTNLVKTTRKGTFIEYQLADPFVGEFFRNLRLLGERQLTQIQVLRGKFHDPQSGFQTVNIEEFLNRLKSGKVTVLDVRPGEEFVAGHLKGALSVPLSELEHKLNEIPKDKEVFAYCRGPYCVMAKDAVAYLTQSGFQAFCLEEGIIDFPAWGLKVEGKEARN